MFFKKRNDDVRRCPEGHIQEPTWDHCPYCEDDDSSRIISHDMDLPVPEPVDPPVSQPPTQAPQPAASPAALPPRPSPPRPAGGGTPGGVAGPPRPGSSSPAPSVPPVPDDEFDDLTIIRPAMGPPPVPPPVPEESLSATRVFIPPEPEPEPDQDNQAIWLEEIGESGPGQDHRMPPTGAVVGSGPDCGIVVSADEYVSGRHMEITRVGVKYQIQDLNSTNGTFVNGERVTRCDLHDGDKVRIGGTQFLFKTI